jgi:hypothetical protein
VPISRLLAITVLAMAIAPAGPTAAADKSSFEKVSFYFAAHQDDWQLFMNPSAFKDVSSTKTKTVFIHMTAGDAGLGMGRGGRKHPFYLARENGAEAAIRFMADADGLPGGRTAGLMSFRGHEIYRVSYRDTVSYYFRVPDGNPGGGGYYDTGYQSLNRLAKGEIDVMSAIDGSTSYRGWSDLVMTVRAIIDYERGNAAAVQLNVADTDSRINPNDHSDHLMTAKAALDAVAVLSCVRRAYYVEYASSRLPENLSSHDRDMESSVFAVTLAGVLALDHGVAWQRYDKSYVGRNYFRVDEGNGRCNASGVEERVAIKR